MKRLLLLKAHVPEHQRHLSGGKVVTVRAHDDTRAPGAATLIPPAWVDGKHGRAMREYVRPVPAHSPFVGGGRKLCRIHHFKEDGMAHLTHPSGYVTRHKSLDEALEHAERTIYTPPAAPEKPPE